MEPIINSQVPEFKVQAFQNGSFKTVSSEDIKGKWAIFFFYPADFTFVCPTELVDMADKYGKSTNSVGHNWSIWLTSTANFRRWVSKYIP